MAEATGSSKAARDYYTYFYIISSSLVVVVVPCAIWKWRAPLHNLSMNALAKVGNVIRCGWLRYEPQDDEEVYDDLLRRASILEQQQQQTANNSNNDNRRSSVASAIAQFEQNSNSQSSLTATAATNSASTNNLLEGQQQQQLAAPPQETTCSEKAMSGASLFFGLFGRSSDGGDTASNTGNASSNNAASVRAQSSKNNTNPTCLVCQSRIFPTEDSTRARNKTYHTGCFKCSLCKSKLKNHPDEEHQLMTTAGAGGHNLYLQCSRCKIDNENKYKPRQLSRVAGEKIVVEDAEQGDIEQVVDAIGDELEVAIFAMIPRCATCGGDFLQYKGEVSIVGSLKYHQECFMTGRPMAGISSAITMDATQAAKYLPKDIILRLASGSSGKVLTTLFFGWKDREVVLKAMRTAEQTNIISASYSLDDEARANPNHRTNRNNAKKTMLTLPRSNGGDESIDLKLDIVGGDQISPQAPSQEGAVFISSGYQTSPFLEGKIVYSKYNLRHSMILQIPCNVKGDILELLDTKLTVMIKEESA